MRFQNRSTAGAGLVAPIRAEVARGDDAIVLALPRGGVMVAAPVAAALELPLDVLIVRKLGLPLQPEVAMGSIARGQVFLDLDVIRAAGVEGDAVERVIAREQRELERRERVYRHGAGALSVENRTVILIDDGIATGSTMLSAVRAVRASNPAKIILAVPVAPVEALVQLRLEVDAAICLVIPSPFHGVSQWYRDFSQLSDKDVVRLLRQIQTQEYAAQRS